MALLCWLWTPSSWWFEWIERQSSAVRWLLCPVTWLASAWMLVTMALVTSLAACVIGAPLVLGEAALNCAVTPACDMRMFWASHNSGRAPRVRSGRRR